MLKFISWKEYFIFLLVATLIYYAVVILRYYRKDVLHYIGKNKKRADEAMMSNDELLLQDLQKLFAANVKKKIPSEELFLHIRKMVQQYPPEDEVKVNEFINEYFPELDQKYIRRIWQ